MVLKPEPPWGKQRAVMSQGERPQPRLPAERSDEGGSRQCKREMGETASLFFFFFFSSLSVRSRARSRDISIMPVIITTWGGVKGEEGRATDQWGRRETAERGKRAWGNIGSGAWTDTQAYMCIYYKLYLSSRCIFVTDLSTWENKQDNPSRPQNKHLNS